jgi:hypothetical protein
VQAAILPPSDEAEEAILAATTDTESHVFARTNKQWHWLGDLQPLQDETNREG